jgi:alpha-D-xyloside xylohydrolase
MITPVPRPSMAIDEVRRDGDALVLVSTAGTHRLQPVTAEIVRVSFTRREHFQGRKTPGVIHEGTYAAWDHQEVDGMIRLSTGRTTIEIDRATASCTYRDASGTVLLREKESDSKTLEEFDSYRILHDDNVDIEEIETPDGVKRVIRNATKVPDKKLYRTRLHLQWQDHEALYGLGQHEEGVLNLRGTRVYLHQANMKIPVPVLASSLGYGILFDTYSPMIFSDNEMGSYVHCEADHEMDFYFINGGSLDGVVGGYRQLTGKAVMLPRWAYGYIQSQERYETQEEILSVAEEFRRRKFGLDCLVLDWCSWPGTLWGQKTMDPERFPDPAQMMAELHAANVRLMISIWPTMDEGSANHQQFKDRDLLIQGTTIYDAFRPEARELYWQQVCEQFYPIGIDAWWCDSSEPITPEWWHMVKPEPDAAYHDFCAEGAKLFDTAAMNAFSFHHAMGMYEGQRGESSDKRVVNLTRSGYTGQQRFGTILWSGDVAATWDTLRKQIVAGLNFCASGLPYWTTDIGAFFVKRGLQWFWDGDYEDGNQDPGYRELYVRWFQYGCFSPVFRSHGTDTRREPWLFGDDGDPFYEALVKANRLRYMLMPYLYTQAYRVWSEDATIQRMLAFDFPGDDTARSLGDQFLFGDRLMVCPVTHAMYYGKNAVPLDEPKSREVYLPPHPGGWYDFHTGSHYLGGITMTAPAEIDTIPVYVKAGTILPTYSPAASTDELDTQNVYVKVYRGLDASFGLYHDAGDGYGYEEGQYAMTRLNWDDEAGALTVAEPEGSLAAEVANRTYHLEVIG